MTIVNFNAVNYQTEGAVPQDGAILIASMPGAELVTLHNLLNSNMSISKRVKKFADKKTALKRVAAKLVEYDNWDDVAAGETGVKPKTKKAKSKTSEKKTRKKRGMFFFFRPEATIRTCKGSIKSKSNDTRTLRQRAVDILTDKGATLKQLMVVVTKFDKDRGVETNPDTLERRTYELVRIMHYYLGYGLKMVDDVIIAYTDPKDAPKN